MRIVVTGSTGLLGRPLVVELVRGGYEVTVLSRNPGRYQDTFPHEVALEKWDGQGSGQWIGVVDGALAIINLAGENLAGEGFLPSRWSAGKKRRIRDSRQKSGQALVKAIDQVADKPKVLIQASAIGYYGPRKDELIDETASSGHDFLASVCLDWEDSTAAVETMGVRRVVIRTGLVQTPEGGPLARLLPLYKLFVGGYFGNGRQWWSWIHIQDEIRAIRYLIENEAANGPVNLVAPNPLTGRDFGKVLGKVLGRPSYMPVPGFAMRLLVGEVATLVLEGQKVIPGKLERLGFTFRYPDAEGALRDLLKSQGTTDQNQK